MEPYDIALLGGDSRTAYMEVYFAKKGYRVICYGTEVLNGEDAHTVSYAESWEEAVEQSRIVVGGIPFFKGGVLFTKQADPHITAESLLKRMKKKQTIFGGVIPEDFVWKCEEQDVFCYDFMKDEALAVFNAVATAEGTVLEAIKNQKTNLHGSSGLVLGYGRCGKILAEKLKGMGQRVTVCGRNEIALAQARSFGYDTLLLGSLEDHIHNYEYIYNTIPAVVLGKNMLQCMRRDALVLDIASAPGGVDYKAAGELGIKAMLLPGLPGKYAPKISAKEMVDFVVRNYAVSFR